MKLYLLKQSFNNDLDIYDSMVVCAASSKKAIAFSCIEHPYWAPPEKIIAKYIGEAAATIKPGIIRAPFNAG